MKSSQPLLKAVYQPYMVRVSDARMSGTAYGTVVLHCSREAAGGGPLALVKNGDIIGLNIENRKVNLLVNR